MHLFEVCFKDGTSIIAYGETRLQMWNKYPNVSSVNKIVIH